jgi:hypothetical protein
MENDSQKVKRCVSMWNYIYGQGTNGSGMTFKKAIGVGVTVATLLHVLVIARLISSMVLWPGFLAHFLI